VTLVFGDLLNKNFTTKFLDKPYPCWILDNFLDTNLIDNILENWLPADDPHWHNEYSTVSGDKNLLEQGMKSISKPELMPELIADLLKYFHSDEFTAYIGKILDISELVSDKHMRWSGMRNMLPNSFQLIHSDARKSKETGLRKELTCLLYLNKDYERQRDQGCLELWNDEMTECIHQIEPIANRLVIFLNSDTAYHGVPVVLSERKAITFSILKDGDTSERYKALFVARPDDSAEVKLQGVKRSQI
jgi:hypothetical protein